MDYVLSKISLIHLNTLFILGLALFGGTMGGRLFQKIKFPQVVGYILIGVLLGQSGLKIMDQAMVKSLLPFNYFALGLIGFMIGGELKKSVLEKYGKQFIVILLFEGLTAFVIVTLTVGFAATLLLDDPVLGWSLGILLGAISSATAPASTTDVLWENKAKGPLTTTVFGIVALDDALALILFAAASGLAMWLLGTAEKSLALTFLLPVYEIGGAVLIGGLSGLGLVYVLKRYPQKDRVLVFLVGTVMIVLGLSVAVHVSMILAAMVLGMVVVNGLPNMSKDVFSLVENFASPVFVLFFVIIGAKLNVGDINGLLLVLIAIYLVGRTGGKMLGAVWGARAAHAAPAVQKYLPLCLFSQAGVAVGLSIVAAHLLPENVGNLIIIIITASTFVVQLIGPPCVRLAVRKAGEAGRNVTEEDITRATKVSEMMDSHYPKIEEDTPFSKILSIFSTSPYTQYPVVDHGGQLSGFINIDSIKDALNFGDSSKLLLGNDLKSRFEHHAAVSMSMYDAKRYMDTYRLGYLPVTDDKGIVVGGIDRRMYQRYVSTKLMELQ